MNESTLLMIFIGVSSLAIVIQAVILAGMYAATKKTSAQIEKLAEEVRTKALPAVESVQMMIVDNKGKVEEIIDNLTVATSTARSQLVRIDATLNDVLDRTRLQVMRADELATSTMDRIEETTEIVQHTIISPVRRINGVLSALSTGMGMFVAGRRAQKASPKAGAGQQEDMFI
jgi:hypothetical protein